MAKTWELSSGETEALDNMQNAFNEMFVDEKGNDFGDYDNDYSGKIIDFIPEDLDNPQYYKGKENYSKASREVFEMFRNKMCSIKSVPTYRFILRMLLIRYGIGLGEKQEEGLFKLIESGDKLSIKSKLSEVQIDDIKSKLIRDKSKDEATLSKKDYLIILSLISSKMEEDYINNGYEIPKSKQWTTIFKKIVFEFNSFHLNNMALGLQMDFDLFTQFRVKVLKLREYDFFDKDTALRAITLVYANRCMENRYFDAYDKVCAIYQGVKSDEDDSETKVITRNFMNLFNDSSFDFSNIFKKELPEISNLLSMLSDDRKTYKNGTVFTTFMELFNSLVESFKKNEKVWVVEKEVARIRAAREVEEPNVNVIGRDLIFKALYGNRCDDYERDITRYIQLLDIRKSGEKDDVLNKHKMNLDTLLSKEDKVLAEDFDEMIADDSLIWNCEFITSREFRATRIRNNYCYADNFPTNETDQRNLIISAAFINYCYMLRDYRIDNTGTYKDIVENFCMYVNMYLDRCGFRKIYSGYAYDAFIKMLLAFSDPLEVLKYVWRIVTNSDE